MRQNIFEREAEVLRKACEKADAGNPTAEDFRALIDEYAVLLSQSSKIVSIGDATQNKLIRAQKMLHRAVQRYKATADQKSELLSIVSHEIKNKAAPIRELSRWVIEDVSKGDNIPHALELLKHICDAADQLIKSVNDTLHRESSRTTSIVPVFEWGDLSRLAQSAVDNQRPCAVKKGISINEQIAPGCETMVDEFLMGEVFENLVSNAVKFSEAGSDIDVSLNRDDSAIRFSVRDRGQGLSDEDKAKIFGKFQTLSSRPTGGEVSTGLGLFIANKLVTLHQGRIEVQSEGKGMGSVFSVVLPVPKDKSGDLQFRNVEA
jgi:signal transduction histidine kinase